MAAASIGTRTSSLVVVGQQNLSLDAVVRCGDDQRTRNALVIATTNHCVNRQILLAHNDQARNFGANRRGSHILHSLLTQLLARISNSAER